jgi:Tfp pilus assembly protein PilZ
MAIDRRRAKRYVVVDLDLHDHDKEQAVGKVVNISDGGLFAIADLAYSVGEVGNFYILLSEVEDEPVILLFTAWVIWSHPNRLHPDKYSLGLEFIDSPDIKMLLGQEDSA